MRLLSKKAPKKVLVYVESDEDIAFWYGKITELNHYRNNLIELDKALKTNTEYKSCFLYEKIKTDLDIYIGKIQK